MPPANLVLILMLAVVLPPSEHRTTHAFVPFGVVRQRQQQQSSSSRGETRTTAPPLFDPSSWFPAPGVACFAKRKKRRQNRDDDDSSDSDLPDFDVGGDTGDGNNEPLESSASSSSRTRGGSGDRTTPAVTSAMMGSPTSDVKSVRELLGDRSLERKMIFDEPSPISDGDPPLPDLVQIARQQRGGNANTTSNTRAKTSAGKKRRSRTATPVEEEEEENLLSKVPFILNDKGEISPQKLLEAGTWLGIALLVLWEVYINTPFFDRAAPMAPVVY